jgi:hypothetical protein
VNHHLIIATLLSLGCALAPKRLPPYRTPVWVRSHNASPVDVYVLCGSADTLRLGRVDTKGSDAFEIPAGRAQRCAAGLNFFLVARGTDRGYRVGPFRAARGDGVQLVIEKYAGLSNVSVAYYGE